MFSKVLDFAKKNIEYSVLILSIIIFCSPLILYNLPATHDGYWHINWAYHWSQQVLSGQLFPRWFEDAFGGLGTPTFSFYPPLFRSLSLPFALLGMSATQLIIGSIIIVLIINGLGSLIYTKLIFGSQSKTIICISILLAIFNPYLIINIFVRGAWAEACAMSLIPWILIATKLSMESNHKLKELPLIISYSLLCLSHLPSLIMVTFLYFSYPFFLITQSFSDTKKYLRHICLPIGLSFGLTSFYLIPVYFDQALTKIYIPNSWIKYDQDLRFLIDNILKFTPNFPSNDFDQRLVGIFFFLTLVSIIFILLLVTKQYIPKFSFAIQDFRLIAFLSFISLLMITDLSRPLYFFIPTLTKIQFSWRFLSIPTSLLPFMCIGIILILTTKVGKNIYQILVQIGIIFLLTLGILVSCDYSKMRSFDPNIMRELDVYLSPEFTSQNKSLTDENNYNYNFQKQISGHNGIWGLFVMNNNEVVPVDVDNYLFSKCFDQNYWTSTEEVDWVLFPKNNYPLIEWIEGSGEISAWEWKLGLRKFKIKTSTKSVLNLKTFYYPGWRIYINSVPLADNWKQDPNFPCAPDGRIQLNLPPGEYDILISYNGTNAENIAFCINFVFLILIVIYFLLSYVLSVKAK